MSIVNIEALKQNNCILHWTGDVASANSPKQITSYGDCKQILPFPGAGIGMFDGTGDYIRFTSTIDFTVTAWTVKFKIYPKSFGATGQIIFGGSTSGTPVILIADGGAGLIALGKIGSETINGSALTVNTWNDITVTKNNLTITIYKNGVQVGQGTIASNFTNPSIVSVAAYSNGTIPFNGYISELKFQTGIDITPIPNKQLESDSNTKLLLHFNRNDSTFIDSSPLAHTITAYGDAKQLCSPVGSGVAYFDGTGDYLSFTNLIATPTVDFRSNATIECSFNLVVGNDRCLFCIDGIGGVHAGHTFYINASNKIACIVRASSNPSSNYSYVLISNQIISINTWYHFAFVIFNNIAYLYINGELDNQSNLVEPAAAPNNGTSTIGVYYNGINSPLNGYMSEVRISNTARYTDNFTPSTQPFRPDPNTKLLLHMDGVGNAFYDSSDPPGDNGFPILPDGVTITPNGTFTTQKMKDGRNIWKFDGSTNYITISDHASWSMFLNDFTIVGWVKFDSVAANKVIIGQYTDANNQWYLQWTTSNIIQLYGITSSTARFNFSCPLTAVANTWYHIVVQRSGSSCVMYINGVAQTVTQTTAFSATATDIAAVLSIGKINTEYQAGNIKDLQIFTKALTMDQVSALYQETYIY